MTRPTRRAILEVAIPVSIESSFQVFLGFLNQVIVGVLGTVAIAGVGLANNVLFIGILCLSAIGSGTGILVAQAKGRGDEVQIAQTAWVGIGVASTIGIVVAIPFIFSSEGFLRSVGSEPDVIASAAGYLALVAISLPLVAASTAATAVFRSIGQNRLPMTVAILTGLTSPVLAWLFIHRLGFGEVGAGIGLVVAQGLKTVILLALLAGHRRGIGFALPRPATAVEEARQMIPLVMPLFITEIVFSSGIFVYSLLFGRIGTEELAVFQIVSAIEGVFVVGTLGFHAAGTVLVGQAVGRGVHHDIWMWSKSIRNLAVKVAAGLGLLFAATVPFLEFLYPNIAVHVLSMTATGILISALFLPVKAANIVLFGTLASGGDTRFLLWSDIVTMAVVGIPLAYLLGITLGFGLWGVFAARLLGEELVRVSMLGFRWKRGRWIAASRIPAPASG